MGYVEMINAVSVTNHSGETLRCILENPEESGFSITNIDGLVPGKATLNVKDIATLDGVFFQNARLPYRNIVLSYIFHDYYGGRWIRPSGGGEPHYREFYRSIEKARQVFYQYYVIKKPVTLLFETDLHKYQINGYVESNEPIIFSDMEGAQVSIICPDPYFHLADDTLDENGNQSEPVFNPGGSFEFPFSNPVNQKTIEFANRNETQRESTSYIYYEGDIDTGVIFHVYVTGTYVGNYIKFIQLDPDDEEQIIGEVWFGNLLYSDGLQIGDELIISTIPGNKYAIIKRGAQIINVFSCLKIFSDWIKLQKGRNTIYISSGALLPYPPNIYITMEYPILFAGI